MLHPKYCSYCGQPLVAGTYPNCTTEGCYNQLMNFKDNYDERIFTIPKEDKPIKIVYEQLPCPLCMNYGDAFRCKHAKSKLEDMNFIIYCSAEKCELGLKNNGGLT
jgi:hypothetical protein